ncbi:MAG: VOC family protein [Burkholderiales bacterium]
MGIPKNALNWFEIPVIDFERAKKFYSAIFSYDMPTHQRGEKMLGFFPMERGLVGGAIVKAAGYVPSQTGTLVYLNCGEDLTPYVNRIKAAGGNVLLSKTIISKEIGYLALFTDTEGNKLALHSAG